MIRTTMALLALALLGAVNPLGAQENGARAQLDRFAEGLQTLHARFEQQVISTDGALQDRSEGEVWLRRPERFRWEYGGDFPELVVADGERGPVGVKPAVAFDPDRQVHLTPPLGRSQPNR